ncbi:MAG: hypothetical protein LCH41_07325 [Armatimonadetes bacterium]|nr:hypothetical protein [Armatimonadota bacterium]
MKAVWLSALAFALAGCVAEAPVESGTTSEPASIQVNTSIGFRSDESLREHYNKHHRQWGEITRAEYLFMAQELRDTPSSKDVLVAYRPDGVVSKYDRRDNEFLAYNRNLTIRTFFRPNDGERYFHRQKRR